MSLNLIKLISMLILALLIGCSSGDSGEPSNVVFVSANDASNGDSTTSTDTNTGSPTGADTGSETGDTGDGASTSGETDIDTAGADTTSGNVDAGTDAGTDVTAGTTTDGTATAGTTTTAGTTDGSDTDAGTDGVDTTTGSLTGGTTDDTGTTTDGTATATDGTTAGTNTDAGTDTAGTDDGETAGETTGTTAGTDTEGTGTTTTGMTDYPPGSLADILSNNEDISSAFAELQAAGLDTQINEVGTELTLFLPTNDAIDALASPSDFVLGSHTFTLINSSTVLERTVFLNPEGIGLIMEDGTLASLEGGGTAPLTIGGAEIIDSDIVGNTGPTVVHVIDAVIEDFSVSSPYEPGSLADVLFQRGDMTNALEALQVAGLDDGLNVPRNQWTLFLPNDSAFDDQDDFNVRGHINQNVSFRSDVLDGLVGSDMAMSSGDVFMFGGGGTESLTIGDATIAEPDVQPIANRGPVVHIIDRILVPQ